jgi:hypothetical protein
MDRDKSVPKRVRQESVDPPTKKFDAARKFGKKEALAASAKKDSEISIPKKSMKNKN